MSNANDYNDVSEHIDTAQYSKDMLAAIEEARRISQDTDVPKYSDMESLIEALEGKNS